MLSQNEYSLTSHKINQFLRIVGLPFHMGGIGHGDHESTDRKKEEDKRKFLDRDFSNLEPRDSEFRGTISISNMPEKIEFIDQDSSHAEVESQADTPSIVYRNAEELEIRYEMLSPTELDGLELLDTLETGDSISNFSTELVELMHRKGLLKNSENELEITTEGRQTYNNWASFRDNYLTGRTDENRFDVIESDIGVSSMPWFLEETSGIELTLDDYLRRKDRSRSRYNPESEFESILSTLYGTKRNELGDHIRALDVLSNPEKYEEQEVSESVQQELRHVTPLGLLDDEGTLTQDGEALYRKVRADAYNLEW